MNTKKKGDAVEKKFYDAYCNKHPDKLVMRSPRTMKRIYVGKKIRYVSQANDFHNLFDMMVQDSYPCYTGWFQIKSNTSHVSTFKKKYREKKEYFNRQGVFCVLYVPYKGFVIYDGNDDWYKSYYDLKLNPCEPFKITK